MRVTNSVIKTMIEWFRVMAICCNDQFHWRASTERYIRYRTKLPAAVCD